MDATGTLLNASGWSNFAFSSFNQISIKYPIEICTTITVEATKGNPMVFDSTSIIRENNFLNATHKRITFDDNFLFLTDNNLVRGTTKMSKMIM